MIKPIKMFAAVCDGCEDIMDIYDGTIALTDKHSVKDEMYDSDWAILKNEKCYCPKCHTVEWVDDEIQRALSPDGKILGLIDA